MMDAPRHWGRAIALVAALAVAELAVAGSYHLRPDGTASTKEAATACNSPATAMNIDTYLRHDFAPGDSIVLCSEGGVFRSTLYARSGGTQDQPIIFTGRGTAVVSGSDIVSGWTNSGGQVYTAIVTLRPQQLFINGIFGDRKGDRTELEDDRDWFWEANTLYLFSSSGDPDLVFNDPGVEAGARNSCVGFGGQDHVVFEGITARHANLSGFQAWNPGSNIRLSHNTAEWNWHVGIDLSGDTVYADVLIEDNTARFNGTGGIALLGPGRNSIIRRNECHGNGRYQSARRDFEEQHQWTFGIKLWEYTNLQEGNEVYFNICHDNGRFLTGDNQGRGVGIWIDGVSGNPNNLNVVRHNLVYDNGGNGIFIEISSNSLTLGNVLLDNASNDGGENEFTPANIVIDARESFLSSHNYVLNNTAVGGRAGLKIATYHCHGCSVDNNTVRNNIIVGAAVNNLLALFGGDNDDVFGSYNRYEHNNFGVESSSFIRWGSREIGSYQELELAYGMQTFSVKGDPLLFGSSPTTLYLTSDSPCIDAGANLGREHGTALDDGSQWTQGVVTTDQDLHGSGWEIGAYVFNPRYRRIPQPIRRLSPVNSLSDLGKAEMYPLKRRRAWLPLPISGSCCPVNSAERP
jgi:hypothetical protein